MVASVVAERRWKCRATLIHPKASLFFGRFAGFLFFVGFNGRKSNLRFQQSHIRKKSGADHFWMHLCQNVGGGGWGWGFSKATPKSRRIMTFVPAPGSLEVPAVSHERHPRMIQDMPTPPPPPPFK